MKIRYDGVWGFISNGTRAGTRRVWHTRPGCSSFIPQSGLAGNGRLLLTIDEGVTGAEVHTLDVGAVTVRQGVAHGPLLVCADLVLGQPMGVSIFSRKAATWGMLILGLPTATPWMLADSGFYFDQTRSLMVLPIAPASGLKLVVPNQPALVGTLAAMQGFVAPGKGFICMDFTQGLILVLGR